MAINPKVLEVAENAFAPQLSDDMKAHLHRAVKQAMAVADLIEHRELNEALVERNEARGKANIVSKKLNRARRDVEELRRTVRQEKAEVELQTGLADEQGKQLAALREAVVDALRETEFWIAPASGRPTVSIKNPRGQGHRNLRDIAADTAKAAALYQQVPEGYVAVPLSAVCGAVKLGRDFYKETGTSPCLYPDWLRELGVRVDNMLAALEAEPRADKPEPEDGR